MIIRSALVDDILQIKVPIIVISALAGMGKSTLLKQIGAVTNTTVYRGTDFPSNIPAHSLFLWDVPDNANFSSIPDILTDYDGQIIIATRPNRKIDGLERAVIYQKAFMLDKNDLVFKAHELVPSVSLSTARRIINRTKGWPLLVSHAIAAYETRDDIARWNYNEKQLSTFLNDSFLPDLESDAVIAIDELLRGNHHEKLSYEDLYPLISSDTTGKYEVNIPHIISALTSAISQALAHRLSTPKAAFEIAQSYLKIDRSSQAILSLLDAKYYDLAREIFEASGGHFFIYIHGPNAYDTILSRFPDSYIAQHESLALSRILQALKHGDVSSARHLFSRYFGDEIHDYRAAIANNERYSQPVRSLRLLTLVYEDSTVDDELFASCFRLLDELPQHEHMQRGSFFNVMMEFYTRIGRFAEAEQVAERARIEYRAANSPSLEFFIALHQSIIRILLGDVVAANTFCADATTLLASAPFKSTGDERILKLVQSCILYESGNVEPLARFLSDDFDAFAHSEIWPTLLDFAIQYGSQALAEHFSSAHARNFLNEWRVYAFQNQQFQTLIDIREIAILQNSNRWQEASEKLSLQKTPISRTWILTHHDELQRVSLRDDMMLILVFIRQVLFETPDTPDLMSAMFAMSLNPYLKARHRASLDIWMAYLHKRQRSVSKARVILQKTFENAGRMGTIAPLMEEKYFLSEMIDNQRINDFLESSPAIRQVVSRLRDTGISHTANASKFNLSRKELKVLLMVNEGGSNKYIANVLGITEATIKFHLTNIYKKLGCANRKEAILTAREAGLMS